MDQIVEIVSGEVAALVVGLVLTALSALAGLAIDAMRKKLGEERTEVLRARLDQAIDRAIDAAAKQGVTRDSIEDTVAVYIANTLHDTMTGLKATPDGIAHRVSAQVTAKLGPVL